jgi:hypothetical protein
MKGLLMVSNALEIGVNGATFVVFFDSIEKKEKARDVLLKNYNGITPNIRFIRGKGEVNKINKIIDGCIAKDSLETLTIIPEKINYITTW